MIDQLFNAGVDVFRLNMSHGDHAGHAAVVRAIRDSSIRAARPAGILCDISGPKIRIGVIPDGPVELTAGSTITLTTDSVDGTKDLVSVTYPSLPRDVKVGQQLLLDDGLLELQVTEIEGHQVHCRVVRGGPLSSRKGLNLPNTQLSLSSLTDKDRADIEWGLENDVDMFAISFVRTAGDIRHARSFMESLGGSLPLIAKIEKGEAVANIEDILRESDGAMVARGDLGVEIPLERVPHVQKQVIRICNRLGKPVITATQMLDSMIRSARPTRAEVTDVANAILDGTDAVMLSAETASGKYPLEAVHIMNKIAEETERHFNYQRWLSNRHIGEDSPIADAITTSAAMIARDIKAKKILCLTQSGSTVRRVARYHSQVGQLAYCPVARTAQQLCLSWGVTAASREGMVDIEVERRQGAEVQIRKAISLFRDRGLLKRGEIIVVTGGLPLHQPGTTNLVRVVEVD
jgi:pyruvate kinase